MKTITLTVDDEVYDQAVRAAQQRRKSLGDLFRELVVALRGSSRSPAEVDSLALQAAWNLADSKPLLSVFKRN